MKTKLTIVVILLATLFASSCENEDNITEIFNGKRFKITGLTINSAKVNDIKPLYEGGDVYWISFTALAFQGVLEPGMTIEGAWKADGKSRRMTINIMRPEASAATTDLGSKIYGILNGATSYSGDTNIIRIKKDEGTYIELSSR